MFEKVKEVILDTLSCEPAWWTTWRPILWTPWS
mgnify:CR=1 FL=1